MLIIKILVAAVIIFFLVFLSAGIIDTIKAYLELRQMRRDHEDDYIIKEDDDDEHLS